MLPYGYIYKASCARQPSLVIFDIRALWVSECPNIKNYKWWLNPVWHRMLYSCTHMATVCVRGYSSHSSLLRLPT